MGVIELSQQQNVVMFVWAVPARDVYIDVVPVVVICVLFHQK